MSDAEYATTLARIFQLRRFGMRPGLEVMRTLLERLDHPERRFRAIHVAGSKGKGSVCAMIDAILSTHGLRTGLFTSPHLQSYRERIQVGRVPIDREAVVTGLSRVLEAATALADAGTIERYPTFFEVTTALAFDHFAREGVDAAVIEVGLGGRLDSTNLLDAPVGVITTIEHEHTEILGPTLTNIASEKAGILHPGMTAVVGEGKEEPWREIDRRARQLGVGTWRLDRELRVEDRRLHERGQRFTVVTPHHRYETLQLPLFGTVQSGNAALAIGAVERFFGATDREIDVAEVRRGLGKVRWRGRLERIARRPDLFVDVAHTPESVRATAVGLGEISPFEDPDHNVLLFGCLSDKRPDPIFEALAPLARTIVLVPLHSDRSARVDDLRRAAVGRFARIVHAPSVADGLKLARLATHVDGFTLAVGSDYLVGDVMNLVEGRVPDEPDLGDPIHPPSAAMRAG